MSEGNGVDYFIQGGLVVNSVRESGDSIVTFQIHLHTDFLGQSKQILIIHRYIGFFLFRRL